MAATALRDADIDRYRDLPPEDDPCDVLAAAAGLPNALPIVDRVVRCQPMIAWTCCEGAGLAKGLSRRLFSADLLGPDGHVPAPHLRVGLLASKAWTDYPVSRRSSAETYLVLAGVAQWVVGTTGCVTRKPGEPVHHPAREHHRRRSRDAPLLGTRRWSGDLDISSFSVSSA